MPDPYYDDGGIRYYCGDALAVLRELPDRSVHTVVTSPPYFGLRNYGHEAQIGLESTPDAYVGRLVEVLREVRRVLRDDGTLWLNLGDSYAGSWGNYGARTGRQRTRRSEHYRRRAYEDEELGFRDIPPTAIIDLTRKNLIGIPWRVAFSLQRDGWILRSDIIWSKPNATPESVKDRPTLAHEYLFLLAKSPRYYYDSVAIREPAVTAGLVIRRPQRAKEVWHEDADKGHQLKRRDRVVQPTRNKRTVWTVPNRPFRDAHFAVFPPDLVEPCIKAGTSERGCCPECGAPWVRESAQERDYVGGSGRAGRSAEWLNGRGKWAGAQHGRSIKLGPVLSVDTTGWRPGCRHDAPPVPCVVLDPFVGSGTTAVVARRLGRRAIGIDLNPSYLEIAVRRVRQLDLLSL